MEQKHKKFDVIEHEWASRRNMDWSERVLEEYAKLKEETPQEIAERIIDLKCKRCSLGKGMVCQAFTKWSCGICEKEAQHHNSGCPKLCKDCAKLNDLCTECGASLVFGKIKRKIKGYIEKIEVKENSDLENILDEKLYE